jgi:hypothetical protein
MTVTYGCQIHTGTERRGSIGIVHPESFFNNASGAFIAKSDFAKQLFGMLPARVDGTTLARTQFGDIPHTGQHLVQAYAKLGLMPVPDIQRDVTLHSPASRTQRNAFESGCRRHSTAII